MTTRRKFFGWMAASPLAAKAAGDQAIAKLSGVDMTGLGQIGYPEVYDHATLASGGATSINIPFEDKLSRSVAYIKMFGLPSEIENEFREKSKVIYRLDSDIANKKSWSMAFKVTCQRQRNYDRFLNALEKTSIRQGVMARLKKTLGFDFPLVSP